MAGQGMRSPRLIFGSRCGCGPPRRAMYDRAGMTDLPTTGPFSLRARLLSPLADGGVLDEYDGLVEVDARGRISRVDRWSTDRAPASVVDLRPMVILPGLVDLHAHLPQLPNAG